MSKIEKSTPVVVKIDHELKRRWEEAVARLKDAHETSAVAWHRKYETVAEIVESMPPLYLAGGYATDLEFYTSVLNEGRTTVFRNVRVAKLTTIAEVVKFTVTRLNFALSYVESTRDTKVEKRGDIDFDTLKIEFDVGNKKVSRSLIDITFEEMTEALRQVRVAHKPTKDAPARKTVLAAIKRAGVKGVSANVTKTRVTLRVPISGLAAVAQALADFKPPGS